MRFSLTLTSTTETKIPINYQYPLSAAIYKILDRADREYASFLHEQGYGKGFKLFTFSQLECPFRIERDRFIILGHEISFQVAFHLPDAVENFIKGLFRTQQIEIGDKISKEIFSVTSVVTLPSPLKDFKEHEIVSAEVHPLSPLVAGIPNEKGNYVFLSPSDDVFIDSIIYNWREKIKTCFDAETANSALLLTETGFYKNPPRSRLITVKAGTAQETKIRGFLNFRLKLTAERRFIDVLMDCGAGVYNSLGCGMVGVLEPKGIKNQKK